jgi:hypothetical protein
LSSADALLLVKAFQLTGVLNLHKVLGAIFPAAPEVLTYLIFKPSSIIELISSGN